MRFAFTPPSPTARGTSWPSCGTSPTTSRCSPPPGSTTTSTRCAPARRSRRSRAGRAWRCCSPAPAACAAACMVTGIPYRHPAVLANMAVTVDIASGGRLELGLGAGWFEPECEAYGIELGSITERFDRFEEALTVIRSLLTAADDDLRRPVLPAARRLVRAEGGPAAAPADRARRQGRAAAAPAGRPLRRPLELLGRRRRPSSAGCAAAWASCATAEGRAHRRPHAVGQRPPGGGRPHRDHRIRSPPTAMPAPQMICVLLPRPYDPRLLERLARHSPRCADQR